ncbi:hypothetical protein V6N13_104569 [Hibiscus sabdariffa]
MCEDVRDNILHRVGNGWSIDFWRDTWIHGIDPLLSYVPENLCHLVGSEMVATMGDGYGNWLWEEFQHLLPLPILLQIATNNDPLVSVDDDLIGWKGTNDLYFSIKLVYNVQCGATVAANGTL